MLYIGNTKYRVYSGGNRVSINSPKRQETVIKNTLLPSGLLLYDYIENDGLAYINTNYYPNYNTKVVYKEQHTTKGATSFGEIEGISAAGRNVFYIGLTQFGFDNIVFSTGITKDTNIHTVELSKDGLYKDSTLISAVNSNISTSWVSPREMYLFALNRGNSMSNAKYILYYLKIYDNEILIHNFIPCTYFGEPGMWDTVENKFYGNEGSGEFILGNKIILREYEYLENVSNSYINLEYIPTNITGIKIEASPNKVQSALILLGRGSSSNNTRWWLNFTSGGSLSLGWNTAYSVSNSYLANTWYVIKHNYLNSRTNSVNNIVADSLYPNLTLTSDPISLFTNKTDPSNYVFTGKVKYLYITEGDQIVRNFVPCTYNGIPGMWDKIELKFYGSSNNGTFIVNNEVKCYNTLIGDGNAYIETNFIPTKNTEIRLKFDELSNNSGTYYPIICASGTGIELFTKANTNYAAYNGTAEKLFTGPDSSLEPIEVILKHNYFEANDVIYINTVINENLNPTISLPIFGFKNSSNAMDSRKGSHRLYYLKIYDNGVLVRDFVPCLYNREAGLWDLVERKFYGNANSAGLLTVGNDS